MKHQAKQKRLLPCHYINWNWELKKYNKKESNDKLKETDIKNRRCYYFDDINKFEDFDFDNVLIDEKQYKNILVCSISYKTLICDKPLHIRFDKIDGFISVYEGTRYLVLFYAEKYDSIYNKIRYLTGTKWHYICLFQKSNFIYMILYL